MPDCPNCAKLTAELAAAERERDYLAQHHGGHLPTCKGMDTVNQRCDCGYLDGTAYRDLVARALAAEAQRDSLRDPGQNRVILCCNCGAALVPKAQALEAARAEAIELMRAHERACPKNPLVAEIERLRAQRDSLAERLKKYGRHLRDCEVVPPHPIMRALGKEPHPCTCGLDAALSQPSAPAPTFSGNTLVATMNGVACERKPAAPAKCECSDLDRTMGGGDTCVKCGKKAGK